MTNEEAINLLKVLKEKHLHNGTYDKALKMGAEALEKQIAKKPTHTYKRLGWTVEGCCPECGEPVVFGSRCSNSICGQAIDWSE